MGRFVRRGDAHPVVRYLIEGHARAIIDDVNSGSPARFGHNLDRYLRSIGIVSILDQFDEGDVWGFHQLFAKFGEESAINRKREFIHNSAAYLYFTCRVIMIRIQTSHLTMPLYPRVAHA